MSRSGHLTKPSLDDVLVAEGAVEPPGDTEEQQDAAYLAAWQRLIDSGMVWQLQGWFGRHAMHLISEGHCTAPTRDTPHDDQ